MADSSAWRRNLRPSSQSWNASDFQSSDSLVPSNRSVRGGFDGSAPAVPSTSSCVVKVPTIFTCQCTRPPDGTRPAMRCWAGELSLVIVSPLQLEWNDSIVWQPVLGGMGR